MPGTIRILSLDGGGIRGLIGAVALARIAAALGIAPRALPDQFHLIAGTSTGGIMATGLAAPGARRQGPAELIALYADHGKEIFPAAAPNILADPKYDPGPLEALLAQKLGQTQLSEVSPEILVTAWDLERARPKLFASWRARHAASEDFRLVDVARATSAAPTYFPPAIVQSLDANISAPQRRHALVDGGVFANDPAALAVAEARRLWPRAERVLVLSLGTGARINRIHGDKAKGWGVIGWLPGLIDVFMDGASALTEHELLLRQARDELDYFRLQAALDPPPPAFTMDDAAPPTIEGLRKLGEQVFARFAASGGLNGLKAALAQPKADRAALGFAPDAPGPRL